MSPARRMLSALALVLLPGTAAALAGGEWWRSAASPADADQRFELQPHERRGNPRIEIVGPRQTTRGTVHVWGPYTSIQVNVDEYGYNIVGDAANETSIAVDPTDPNNIVIGWRQFDAVASNFRQAGCAYSHDRGQTWTFPGVLDPGVFRSDPVLDVDANGNFYYYSLTDSSPMTCQMFKSTDKGLTWTGPIAGYGGDKQWIAVDRTTSTGRGFIYAAWDYSGCCGDNWFTRSTDGGQTFMSPIPIPQRPVFGTISVGPDGTVYVVGRALSGAGFVMARSSNAKNGGVTPSFDITRTPSLGGNMGSFTEASPNPGGLLGQAWVATSHAPGASNGHVYMLCSVDPDGTDPMDVMFIRSTDKGRNWSTPVRVNDDPVGSLAWQWFGTMSVAPNGRIDVAWNDTRNSVQFTVSQVYYAYSLDEGVTWSHNVAVSGPFNSQAGWPNQNKIGDYYQMISDDVGASLAYSATFNGGQDVFFLRLGDCNGNGVHDSQDVLSGYSQDCNANNVPDECEVGGTTDCNGNGVPDLCDLYAGTGVDCNGNAVLDECDLAAGTSADCNGNHVPDECDLATGVSADCDGNGVPDECDPDCNHNGVPDACDVVVQTSRDCNSNGIPDECELAAHTSHDCNGNGIPDECDLAHTFFASSAALAPLEAGLQQTFTLLSPPLATGSVSLEFAADGDISYYTESVAVRLNNTSVGTVYGDPNEAFMDCTPDQRDTLLVPAATFNQAAGLGTVAVRMTPSSEVSSASCNSPTSIAVTVSYSILPIAGDLNGNGVPDTCEHRADVDCNGIVDFDDIRPFVVALGGEAAYYARFPNCIWYNADCDCNNQVDFDDITAFVRCLGGDCACP